MQAERRTHDYVERKMTAKNIDSRHLLLVQPEVRDHLLADLELLNLAGNSLRKGVDESHVLRHLEVCEVRLTEGADLLLGRDPPGAQLYPSAELFAVFRVGNADNRGLLDRRV